MGVAPQTVGFAKFTAMPKRAKAYEAEVVPGIEGVAMAELRATVGGSLSKLRQTRSGFLRFRYAGSSDQFANLRAATALYQVHHFDIPRPRAFLGQQHFTRLIEILRATAAEFPAEPGNFGIGAAGGNTSVLRRLRDELSAALDLPHADDDKGQLYLRLLRSDKGGWEALLRTTPAPLSKREYRRVDVPGALNATVAFAMTQLGAAPKNATVVNLCSGSATILIEHGLSQPAHTLMALDIDKLMLKAGRRNASAAGQSQIQHLQADARQTPLPRHCADRLYADLPFGNLIGTHADNQALYPAVLREAERLARHDAAFIVLTQEIRLLRRCLNESVWRVTRELPITLSGLHPRIFVLRKDGSRV